MAPSFFSKLVRTAPTNSPHSRERSLDNPSDSNSTSSLTKPSRSRTVSAVETPPDFRSNEFGVLGSGAAKRLPGSNGGGGSRVVSGSGAGDRGYQSDTGTTSSANPSVRIVPPSPQVTEGSPNIGGSPAKGINGLPEVSHQEKLGESGNVIDGLPSSSPAGSGFSEASQRKRPSSRPPSPVPPTNGSSKKLSKSKSRPTTPVSSSASPASPSNAPPLPQPLAGTNSSNSTTTVKALQTPPEMKHKSSNKSLRSMTIKITPPPVPQNLTHTPKVNSLDSTNSKTSSGGHGLVESPTSVETEFVMPERQGREGKDDDMTPRPDEAPVSPHQRSKSVGTVEASSPPRVNAHRKEATAGVPNPVRQGSGWRKPTSKPTGLAGAIAASGLAMANPGMTGVGMQSAQFSPPISRAQMNRMPSNSNISNATLNVNDDQSQNKKKKEKERKASRRASTHSGDPNLLPEPDLRDLDYYSGLEDSSSNSDDFDADSEDDDILGPRRKRGRSVGAVSSEAVSSPIRSKLESGESLPYGGSDWGARSGGGEWGVTGFAVASSRRNAEFHEVFPGIPEGDYLIEDYGCALQREILIQGRLYISENHVCFHANILGWITDLTIPIYEITSLEKKMTAFVIPNALQITTRQAKYNFASLLARDTTYDVIHNIWRIVRAPDLVEEGMHGRELGEDGVVVHGQGETCPAARVSGGSAPTATTQKKSICECLREGKHYTETAMDTVVPGTPDRIHNLMFASGFIKEFMSGNQKLTDIQISDWIPTSPDAPQGHLARNMSYIKPLNAPVGPKSTKCEIRDEVVHCEFDDYVSTISTTRTPDVPSGSVFSVKTRTCIMWDSVASSRIIVTTQVEWTGRSFIKGIIERSAIDGQKNQCIELERAMRAYIQEHQLEFIPEGVDLGAIAATSSANDAANNASPTSPSAGDYLVPPTPKERERERNQRAFQWAWDTFDGAFKVGTTSAKGAIELIIDAWDQSETTTILYFVIVGLVFSNLYTWMKVSSSGKRELRELRELRRELRARDIAFQVQEPPSTVAAGWSVDESGEREKWIQGIVSALKEEIKPTTPAKGKGSSGQVVDEEGSVSKEKLEETVADLVRTLDHVEAKAKFLRQSLQKSSTVDALD
ncbi:hypothetical protein E1B28_001939 [Marasmius oreades]|uniref:VASt domain-containing protein n=1 Tax=Marasmius oreades TaxID=181124 RepID=A0A9P7V4L8_9AGAR|nr:uncharacterized protein E1B28_001939 [Marasmius oreades]KAG7100159.1 hypothetical protein E1B28_001939 [Marasmius oreades]